MALLNNSKAYFKLNGNGNVDFYENEETRTKTKRATSYEIIENKYKEFVSEYKDKFISLLKEKGLSTEEIEQGSFDLDNLLNSDKSCKKLWDEYMGWEKERHKYYSAVHNRIYNDKDSNDYPLMNEYFPDIYDSIPRISASIHYASLEGISDIKESYEKAKELKIFGETTDC